MTTPTITGYTTERTDTDYRGRPFTVNVKRFHVTTTTEQGGVIEAHGLTWHQAYTLLNGVLGIHGNRANHLLANAAGTPTDGTAEYMAAASEIGHLDDMVAKHGDYVPHVSDEELAIRHGGTLYLDERGLPDPGLIGLRIDAYVGALNDLDPMGDYRYEAEALRKYVRISSTYQGHGRSVHAFVDNTTGAVYKPAGWAKPAKHARFNLTDDASYNRLIEALDLHGGYLYLK